MRKRRKANQASLWDRITGKQQAVQAPAKQPLSAKNWPSPSQPVQIIGDRSGQTYAVVGRMDCGKDHGRVDAYALLVRYEERENPWWKQKGAILIDRLEEV